MKICPNCHQKNSDKFKFCRYCGTKLPAKSVNANNIVNNNQSVNYKYCPNCHHKNNQNAKFCIKCGYQFSSQKASQDVNTQSTKSGSHNNSIPKKHSQHKMSNGQIVAQSQNDNYKYCPNCHYKNNKNVKFCVKCGYQFSSDKSFQHKILNNQTTPQFQNTNYKQQWNQANQSINKVANYSNNYFSWYKDTLLHPLATHKANPYFGLTSMAVMAILIWIANVLGKSNDNISGWLFDIISGNSPLRVYINSVYSVENSSLGSFILSFATIIIYGLFTYIGVYFTSKGHNNFYQIMNRFGSMINVAIPVGIILILGTIIGEAFITSIACMLIEFIIIIATANIIIGVKDYKHSELNRFYIGVLAVLISYFAISIITAIVGIILQ